MSFRVLLNKARLNVFFLLEKKDQPKIFLKKETWFTNKYYLKAEFI